LARGFESASDVAMLPDESVLVAEAVSSGESRSWRLWPDGRRVRILGLNATGLAVASDGSVLAIDAVADANVIRSWIPGTAPTVVASRGGGPLRGFSGDGGPALTAQVDLSVLPPGTSGILALPAGGFLFADTGNERVRRVDAAGTITTVAGTGRTAPEGQRPRGDGGPALQAMFDEPFGLAGTGDGGYVVSERQAGRLRHVRPDTVVETLVDHLPFPEDVEVLGDGTIAVAAAGQVWRLSAGANRATPSLQSTPSRLLDFAGRSVRADGVGRDARGQLLIAARDQVVYVPRGPTSWSLMALRDMQLGSKMMTAVIEATQPGIAELDVLRRGHVVAHEAAPVSPGNAKLSVRTRLKPRWYTVRVSLRAHGGAPNREQVEVHGARALSVALARRLLGSDQGGDETETFYLGRRCHRFGAHRVDCEVRDFVDGFDEVPDTDTCDAVASLVLRASGVVLRRQYSCSNRERAVFRQRPAWDPDYAVKTLGRRIHG
jgi:hypothetical protein